MKNPEINSCLYKQLIFMGEASTYNGLKIVYSVNGVGRIGQIHAEKETRPPSYATHK